MLSFLTMRKTLTRVSEKFAFLACLKLNLFVQLFTGQFRHISKKNEKWFVHLIEVIEKLRAFRLNNGNLKSVNTCYATVLLKIIAFTLQLKKQMIANDFSGQLQLNELSWLSKNNWVIYSMVRFVHQVSSAKHAKLCR